MPRAYRLALLLLLVSLVPAFAQPKPTEKAKPQPPRPEVKEPEPPAPNEPLPGHSYHGEVFNEGPRQKAYLMAGMPKISFPITTKNPAAQQFFTQGIGQVHGFWYYEAERSFRQAAQLDPTCAMAYWGMTLANLDNANRAKKFMAECQKHKAGVSERETLYIDAVNKYVTADASKKKERNEAFTRDLEKLLYKYPDDLEARSMLALQLWKNRDSGSQISSFLAIDALLDQVFRAEPMHPAHHYRIHLWDYERAENALGSAALCGQSSPGVAHMWHMPGHIYSRVRRYEDACYQQEASARVDHAHMMRDRILPDQIHNFAHNNEWFIRNLNHVGRVRDAVDLAKNMISLPRHPKYNSLDRGSSSFGRARLFETLVRYELWDELIALSETPYLEPTDKEGDQQKRIRRLAQAHYRKGDLSKGDELLEPHRKLLAEHTAAQEKAVAKAEEDAKKAGKNEADITKAKDQAKKGLEGKVAAQQRVVDELEGYRAAANKEYEAAIPLLKKGGDVDAGYIAFVQQLAGKTDDALKAIVAHVGAHKNEVVPLAQQVELQFLAGKKDDAKKSLDALREISGSADLDASPLFQRVSRIAGELGLPADWRVQKPVAADTGVRPPLDSLGPFRWSPSPAPAFVLRDPEGKSHSLAEFQGQPVVFLFFLGSGCLHCAEQLQAFGKMASDYEAAGIKLVAISSDDQQSLKFSLENYKDGKLPLLLLADAELAAFKDYRCYDDFEQQTLHGAFVVDGQGLVRWQDIGYQPFMDAKFVLGEAKRLLAQPVPVAAPTTGPIRAAIGGGR